MSTAGTVGLRLRGDDVERRGVPLDEAVAELVEPVRPAPVNSLVEAAMSRSERRVRRRGIEVPAEVAGDVAMPEDLDAEVLDPHAVPDPQRRRRAAVVYVVAADAHRPRRRPGCPSRGDVARPSPLLLAVAGWYLLGAWHLVVREGAGAGGGQSGDRVPGGACLGHLGFRGWRSRPIWNVLVFSADEPPSRRGLVRVDGIDATVVETYAEEVPPGEW